MGKGTFTAAFERITGTVDSDHKLILRQKHLHAPNGKVLKTCDPEVYFQMHKRDFKHNPAVGAELANMQRFGDAARRTKELFDAVKTGTATEEQLALMADYKARFMAQLDGKPDAEAPIGKDGKRRYYARFDNFVRTMMSVRNTDRPSA